jgi:dephospho-CoA kinase
MSIKVIGLTGGIGSGKTTVARIFQSFGFEVYFADERSKSVMNTDPEVRKAIVALLGADSYLPDGNANRKYIGQIIFNNKEKLAAINAIMHPAVQQDRLRWLGELEAKGYDRPFALTEAAILFESGAYRHMQGVITVSA